MQFQRAAGPNLPGYARVHLIFRGQNYEKKEQERICHQAGSYP